jgi:hypothetical protein
MTRTATVPSKRSLPIPQIAGIALVAVALIVAIVAARPGGNAPAPAASRAPAATGEARAAQVLAARETHFDFGSISMAAGMVSHRYWFRNEGTAPVLIQRVYTSCMCTTATLVKGMRVIGRYGMPGHGPLPDVNEALAPGEAAYIDAVFDPAAHGPSGLGRTERVITIERAGGRPLELQFTAYVTP